MAAYVFLILIAIAYIGPLLMLVLTSFKTLPEFTKDATSLPASFSLDNFFEAWDKANFPQYLLNTVIYTVTSTVIFVVSAVFLAIAIARRFVRGGGTLFTLFLIALFLPAALIPQFQLILRLGLYNNPIGYIMLFLVNPIGIVILVNYMRTIPVELDEAAAIEGCGYLRYVLTIVLPLSSPAIATVAVLHAIGVWNELVLATIYLTRDGLLPHHPRADRVQRGLRQQLARSGGRRPDDHPADGRVLRPRAALDHRRGHRRRREGITGGSAHVPARHGDDRPGKTPVPSTVPGEGIGESELVGGTESGGPRATGSRAAPSRTSRGAPACLGPPSRGSSTGTPGSARRHASR